MFHIRCAESLCFSSLVLVSKNLTDFLINLTIFNICFLPKSDVEVWQFIIVKNCDNVELRSMCFKTEISFHRYLYIDTLYCHGPFIRQRFMGFLLQFRLFWCYVIFSHRISFFVIIDGHSSYHWCYYFVWL